MNESTIPGTMNIPVKLVKIIFYAMWQVLSFVFGEESMLLNKYSVHPFC